MKSQTLQALHSSESQNHGTPPEYIEAARRVLGTIDLDPASSALFNELTKAKRFFTKEDDGLAQDWSGTVLLNPPGDKEGKLPKLFWAKLMSEYCAGRVTSAIFIGFSIDQLQTLQNTGGAGPLMFPLCVPRRRMQFVKSLKVRTQTDLFLGDTKAEVGKQPTKANFVSFLPPRSPFNETNSQTDKFHDEFFKFGDVRI